MATSNPTTAVSQDTLITIKVTVNEGTQKKLKLPLKQLGASVLSDKLRSALGIKPEQQVTFERFSDSAGGYITLDPTNPQVFKTLNRAAKAKLKLRLKATVTPEPAAEAATTQSLIDTLKEQTEKVEEAINKQVKMEPVIVQTPAPQKTVPRSSKAADGKAVGSGIFQFREARASEQTLVNDEAPVPAPFSASKPGKTAGGISDEVEVIDPTTDFFTGNGSGGRTLGVKNIHAELPVRTKEAEECHKPGHAWSVYCNNCDKMMDDAHYHCSICDDGDYDLCEECVGGGKLCPGEGHWLIKRVFKNGTVISSTTERVAPKYRAPTTEEKEMHTVPGAYTEEKFTPAQPTRTCNCCVIVLPENAFVTCMDCADYDLCIPCHANNLHGHHPAHGFKPATEATVLSSKAATMLSPGRNARHNAICDGCDKNITGIRHKCLDCPDWDFCNGCIHRAPTAHPRHRFAAIYAPIPDVRVATPTHNGIYCDGPLCVGNDQTYIRGIRFKCAVCHDTDFCASCEALPTNHHNRTHPLIKFKTPVNGVTINTMNQEPSGRVRTLGDQRPQPAKAETKSTSTETTPVQKTNAATQVQTVADFKPTEEKTQPILVYISEKKVEEKKPIVPTAALDAHFAHDTIKDGSAIAPAARFTQIWTLRNPGPAVWPAGCSVRYVGGDNMLNVDNGHPASVSDIANAAESSVCGREVQVGEEVAFKVVLKAPVRQGKAISYWRLNAADGTPFGHRLWCDIEVKVIEAPVVVKTEETKPAAPSSSGLPSYEDVYLDSHARLEVLRQRQATMMQAQQAQRQQTMDAQAAQQQQTQAQQQAQQQMMVQRQQQMAQQQAQQQSAAAYMRPQQSPYEEAYRQMYAAGRLSQSTYSPFNQQPVSAPAMPSYPPTYQYGQLPLAGQAMPSTSQASPPTIPRWYGAPLSSAASSPEYRAEKARLDTVSSERKEAAKLRVEAIKSKILKAREAKAKAMTEARENAIKNKTLSDAAKVKKIVEEASKAQTSFEAEEEKIEKSQMIFPTLERESPASSLYQSAASSSINVASGKGKAKAATVETEEGEVERSASPVVPSVAAAAPVAASVPQTPLAEEMGFDDLTDDLEVLSADGEDSEDDGFLTDDEYDILDASDRETVASP